ncbi:MAG TPA: hypothetical protein VGP24_06745 [Glaciihabitans sp.]|nr:hypothetical protein [Glaciihabitans sp.]
MAAELRQSTAPLDQAWRRFAVVSLCGFLLNETTHAALLRWSAWRYGLLLAAVAAATFVASRRWVFKG